MKTCLDNGRVGFRQAVHERKRWKAFTLTELLVVVATVIILAALLFPTLEKMLEISKSNACVSNLRIISNALHAYIGDHNGEFPKAADFKAPPSKYRYWFEHLEPYVDVPGTDTNRSTDELFKTKVHKWVHCPAKVYEMQTRRSTGYGWNHENFGVNEGNHAEYLNGLKRDYGFASKMTQVIKPSNTIIVGDSPDKPDPLHSQQHILQACVKNEPQYLPRRHNGSGNYLFVDGHIQWMDPDDLTIKRELFRKDQRRLY